MAVVKLYIGPSSDGTSSDSNTGLTRAQRIATPAQLRTLIAGLTSGDTPRVMMEGTFHQGLSGWAVTGSNMFALSNSTANCDAVRISATNTEDSNAPLPIISTFDQITTAWTDTGTTTTKGTKIWSHATSGGTVRDMWAADWLTNANFGRARLWEGGANDSATFTAIHPNLDIVPKQGVFGTCWTQYNAAGALATSTVYMACDVDPNTRYGTITYNTNQTNAAISMAGIHNWTIDAEITVYGGGFQAIEIYQCGQTGSQWRCEAAALYGHPYLETIGLQVATSNGVIAPYIDPMYPYEVPYYPAASTGHSTGSTHGISFKSNCDMAAATSYATGVQIVGVAANGRRSVIRDQFHAGVSNVPGANVHQFISIDGVEFDFAKVKYGRAFAFIGTVSQMRDCVARNIVVRNQPTQSQMNGRRLRCENSKFHSKGNVGNGYVSPWGTTSNKAGTSIGISIYSGTGADIEDIEVMNCEFECEDGAVTVDSFNSVAWLGFARVCNNVLIRPNRTGYSDAFVSQRSLGFSWNGTADQAKTILRDNVLVGYSGNSVRRFQTSPSINDGSTPQTCVAASQSTDWATYETRAAFDAARRLRYLSV